MPRYLNPASLPRPTARASQAVALSGSYKRVIVSAQVGCDASGTWREGFDAQLSLAFDHFLAAIAAAGCEPRDVVAMACYSLEPGKADVFAAAREERLGVAAPAVTYLETAALAQPQARVAIAGEAVQEQAPTR